MANLRVEVGKILVVKDPDERNYQLRIFLSAERGGVIQFNTTPQFTKSEADFRAMALSSKYGFRRDELPTHPSVMPYPEDEE